MEEKFSLKDFLFNKEKVTKIAEEIYDVYPEFEKNKFIDLTLREFPKLELKQRIIHISNNLRKFLPDNYPTALSILLQALPKENDNTKTDNDFGDFIYAPYADFVAKFGRSEKYLDISLDALREITMRFSAEDAIRYFINDFPDKTFVKLLLWSHDPHYHVRRLASEGTRPKLPWAQKISTPISKTLLILENLYSDNTRFVTRSVANHVNDISKIDPDLAISILTKWQNSKRQNDEEMDYILKHSLRTLIKTGNTDAFHILNFSPDANIQIREFELKNNSYVMDDNLEFSITLKADRTEHVLIDYIIHFQNKKREMKSKKVFKLKILLLEKHKVYKITKKHKLKEIMTTRRLYPGTHKLDIQINGKIRGEKLFVLEPLVKDLG